MLRYKHLSKFMTLSQQMSRRLFINNNHAILTRRAVMSFSTFDDNQQKQTRTRTGTKTSRNPSSRGQAKFDSTDDIDHYFKNKYGKTKSELLDQWLEMSNEKLKHECKKMGLSISEKHIDNIQKLFDFVKNEEQQINKQSQQEEELFQESNQKSFQQSVRSDFRQSEQTENPGFFKKHDDKSSQFSQPKKRRYQDEDKEQSNQNEGQKDSSLFKQNQALLSVQNKDVNKAKETLNLQINKILAKRKKMINQVQEEQSHKEENIEEPIPQDLQMLHNHFQNAPQHLRMALSQKAYHQKTINSSSSVMTTNENPQLLDKIFGMSNDKIDELFEQLTSKEQASSAVIAQMNLSKEDFTKNASSTKKKVIIALESIAKNHIQKPHLGLVNSGNQVFQYANEFFAMLNSSNKEWLKNQINILCLDFKRQKDLVNTIEKQHALVQLSKKLAIPPQTQVDIAQQLLEHQNLFIDREVFETNTKENLLKAAEIISFIADSNEKCREKEKLFQLIQLKDKFYMAIKFNAIKRDGQINKGYNFRELLTLLEPLPPIVSDTQNLIKSVNYILLNELLSLNNLVNFQLMGKKELFLLVDKAVEMKAMKDIQNKLKRNLIEANYSELNIDDFTYLCLKLSEDGKPGKLDHKIVFLMFKRSLKTLCLPASALELSKFFRFYDTTYRLSSLVYASNVVEMKLLFQKFYEIQKTQHINLNDAIRFARLMNPSMFKPHFLFNKIMEQEVLQLNSQGLFDVKKRNLRTEADQDELHQLMREVYHRIETNKFTFEHLLNSHSRYHKSFKPYTQSTIKLCLKIFKDFNSDPNTKYSPKELRILNQILACETLSKTLFIDHEQCLKCVMPILEATELDLQRRMDDIRAMQSTKHNSAAFSSLAASIDFEELNNQLQALRSILRITRDHETISRIENMCQSFAECIKHGIESPTNYKLDDLLKLNKRILDLTEQIEKSTHSLPSLGNRSNQSVENLSSILKEVVDETLNHYYLGKKPLLLATFEDPLQNKQLSKKIQAETNSYLIQQNIDSLISHLISQTQKQDGKELASLLCSKITNGRSLVHENLMNLFVLVKKFGLLDEVKPLLVNVAANLETVESQLITNPRKDPLFDQINEKIEADLVHNKKDILSLYMHLQMQDTEGLLQKEHAILRPLSKLMADLFDHQTTDADILAYFQILGTEKLDNYQEDFIKKLYERYSQPEVISLMADSNPKFFFKFAKTWPHFLRNSVMLDHLLKMRSSWAMPKQQQEVITILAQQNILHPELMRQHFDTFIKLKDKEAVAEYMTSFISHAAYLGFLDFDIVKFSQVFRRVFPTPNQVPQVSMLLDWHLVCALSDTNIYNWDEKSVTYFEISLNYIESKFSGFQSVEVQHQHPVTGETSQVRLHYFKSIESRDKVYHKVQVPNRIKTSIDLNLAHSQIFDQAAVAEDLESEDDSDEESKGPEAAKPVEEEVAEILEPDAAKLTKDSTDEETLLESQQEPKKGVDENAENDEVLKKELEGDEGVKKEDLLLYEDEEGLNEEQRQILRLKELAGERSIFTRKAGESQYSEELEFHQYRKRKLQDLDKKSRHLLLFSNINQLNLTDLNKNDVVKAWTVLFHFVNKSTHSSVHDEFESLVLRNANGKAKGHELFNQFYLKLLDRSQKFGFNVEIVKNCPETSWPVDLFFRKPFNLQNCNLFFFLQEEVAFNTEKGIEEPLGIQKLMLKQIKQKAFNTHVGYLTESEFYDAKDRIEEFVDQKLLQLFDITPQEEEELKQNVD